MIVKTPDAVLTTAAKQVMRIDRRVIDVIERMKRELIATKNPKGVGLAAPQIGVSLRIFITRPTEKSPIKTFINPEITWLSHTLVELNRPDQNEGEKRSLSRDKKLEGCLSIPQIWGYLKRSDKLRVKYMDMEGVTHDEKFDGFMSTIIQHETDHLNGILYTKRVLDQGGKFFRIEVDKKGKEELVEIEI